MSDRAVFLQIMNTLEAWLSDPRPLLDGMKRHLLALYDFKCYRCHDICHAVSDVPHSADGTG